MAISIYCVKSLRNSHSYALDVVGRSGGGGRSRGCPYYVGFWLGCLCNRARRVLCAVLGCDLPLASGAWGVDSTHTPLCSATMLPTQQALH